MNRQHARLVLGVQLILNTLRAIGARLRGVRQVGARAKCPARARQQHHPDIPIRVDLLRGAQKLSTHRPVEAVELIRSVERHPRNTALALDQNRLVITHLSFSAYDSDPTAAPVSSNACMADASIPLSLSTETVSAPSACVACRICDGVLKNRGAGAGCVIPSTSV